MKLKNILLEQNKKVKKVSELLQDEFRNDLPQLLYRSTDSGDLKNKVFEVREIRKRRRPIGPRLAQTVLDKIAENRYDNVPKRSESKFASSPDKLGYFGKYEYIIFPDESADIVSFERDTLSYRKDLKNALTFLMNMSENHEFIREKCGYLFDLYVVHFKQEHNSKDFIDNNWNKIEKELKQLKNDKKLLNKIKKELSKSQKKEIKFKINSVLNPSYFRNMKRGFHKNSAEVVFNGQKYLYVKPDFFKKNFEWKENKWEK